MFQNMLKGVHKVHSLCEGKLPVRIKRIKKGDGGNPLWYFSSKHLMLVHNNEFLKKKRK